jgi:hypothetical protein
MPIQDDKKNVASPEAPTTPAPAANDKTRESNELTVQELEARIAPLTVRKAGGTSPI